jgi:hypothetical protein
MIIADILPDKTGFTFAAYFVALFFLIGFLQHLKALQDEEKQHESGEMK